MPLACPTLSVLARINKLPQFVNYLTTAHKGVFEFFIDFPHVMSDSYSEGLGILLAYSKAGY
jgi:hypothetical protein